MGRRGEDGRRRDGLGGLECLSGIPGSAGATPVQNVGAYGVEVADTITRVRLLDRGSGDDRWVSPAELGFGYRRSVLKNTRSRRRAGGRVRARRVGPQRAAAVPRVGAARSGRRKGSARTRRGCATRCWRCAGARAWCSTTPTTTPGASARSSPTRWCQQPEVRPAASRAATLRCRISRRRDGTQAGGGLARRASRLQQRVPRAASPRPVVDQALAGDDQPGTAPPRPTSSAWPAPCVTACGTGSVSI